MPETSSISVSSAEFVRRFGSWQDRAANDPVFVTHHGRRRLVMLSLPHYDALLDAAEKVADAVGEATGIRLEALIQQIDLGFIAFDKQLNIIDVSPAACAYFGISRSGALNGSSADRLQELERPVVRTHLARGAQAGEIATFELPAMTHPGEWVRFMIFPYGDGVGCLMRNITSDRAKRDVEEARRALRDALAADTRIGIGSLTLRGTFSEADERLAALAGFDATALEQVRLTDILPFGRRADASHHVESVLTGSAPVTFDTALLVNNGGEQEVRISLAATRGDYAIDGAMVVVTAL